MSLSCTVSEILSLIFRNCKRSLDCEHMPFVSNISRMHSYSSVSISTQWLMQTNCKAHNNESVTNIYTHQKTKYRNTTGPPCSCGAIIRLEATWRHRPAFAGEAACRQTVECYRRRQMTTTDTSDRNYYGPQHLCRRASNKMRVISKLQRV